MKTTITTEKKKNGMLKAVCLPSETIEILAKHAAKEHRSVKSFMELILIKAAAKLSDESINDE